MAADPARPVRDPLDLLALTAALHAAAQAAPAVLLRQMARTAVDARRCSQAHGEAPCAQGPRADPGQARLCQVLVDHLDLALMAVPSPFGAAAGGGALSALRTLMSQEVV